MRRAGAVVLSSLLLLSSVFGAVGGLLVSPASAATTSTGADLSSSTSADLVGTSTESDSESTQSIGVGDVVFRVNANENVTAIDPDSGELLWKRTDLLPDRAKLTPNKETVFVDNYSDSSLVALDSSDGSTKYKVDLSNYASYSIYEFESTNKYVLVVGVNSTSLGEKNLIAINRDTQAISYTRTLSDRATNVDLAPEEGLAVLETDNGYQARYISNGTQKWNNTEGDLSSIEVNYDGTVGLASTTNGGGIIRFDPTTGDVTTTINDGRTYDGGFAFDDEKSVFYASDATEEDVTAYHFNNTQKWRSASVASALKIVNSPSGDDLVWASGDSGRLYILDKDDGSIKSETTGDFYGQTYGLESTNKESTNRVEGYVSGTVFHNNSTVANATVTVFQRGNRLATTATGQNGNYNVTLLGESGESVAVEAVKPEDNLGPELEGPIYVSASEVNVSLTKESDGNIVGTVESDVGVALEDARVVAVDGDGVLLDKAYTSSSGDFDLNASGYVDLRVEKPTWETATEGLGTLDEGEQVDVGIIRLRPPVYNTDEPVLNDTSPTFNDLDGNNTEIDKAFGNTSDACFNAPINDSIIEEGKDLLGIGAPACGPNLADTERISLLQSAGTLNETTEQSFVELDNFLSKTRGIAYTKGKIAAVEALNRGADESGARQEAKEAINDFYATILANTYTRYEISSIQADYIAGVEKQSASFVGNSSDVAWVGPVDPTTTDEDGDPKDVLTFGNSAGTDSILADVVVTLPNGETRTYSFYEVNGDEVATPDPGNTSTPSGYTATEGYQIRVKGPKGRATTITRTTEFASRIDNIHRQRQQVVANTDKLVNSTYANIAQGEINTSDLIGPADLTQEGVIGYNSTGYQSYSAATLAAIGQGNVSSGQTVVMNGTRYAGTLFYVGSSGSGPSNITTGTTYDPTSYPGEFILATSDGSLQLDKRFIVEEQQNVKTGETIESVEVEDYTPQEANASDFKNQTQLLKDWRERVENAQATSYNLPFTNLPVGGDLPEGSGDVIAILVLLVIVGIVLSATDVIFPD